MNEILLEIALRAAKLIVAIVLGAIVYGVALLAGASGSVQLALEAWIAGALIVLLVETSAF
jgi:hypothetical protein